MLLLLSSARAVRAMACANHSLQSSFSLEEFFCELIVFRHSNMDFTIFCNVVVKCVELNLSQFQDKLNIKTVLTVR